jgi:hypothetical protein
MILRQKWLLYRRVLQMHKRLIISLIIKRLCVKKRVEILRGKRYVFFKFKQNVF